MTTEELLMKKYDKVLLTKTEVMQELSIKQDTLMTLRKNGTIKIRQIGASFRFHISDLAKYIDGE